MANAVFYHPPIRNIPLLTMPLAYLHLATPLAGGKHRVKLVDGRIEPEPVRALLDALVDADVLLITAMPGSQIETALEACRAARALRPELPIFWGGPHPSLDPERTIQSELVSGVVVGRGEFTFSQILDNYNDPAALGLLPNLIVKDRAGQVLRGPVSSFSNERPNPPDYSLLADIEPYVCQTRRSRRMIDYISSFGCPHKCTFCSEPVTSGSRWSALQAEVLVAAIQRLIADYKIDGILFQDAKFVTDRERLERFCKLLIETKTKINWISTACSTDIEPFQKKGMLDLMKESGCEMLFIGAEAASGEMLVQFKKTVKAEGTYRVARTLWKDYGILPHFSYIVG